MNTDTDDTRNEIEEQSKGQQSLLGKIGSLLFEILSTPTDSEDDALKYSGGPYRGFSSNNNWERFRK